MTRLRRMTRSHSVIKRAARGGMPRSGVIAPRAGAQPALGRFIWQLVGVDDTYGSICLIGTKV
jgi:hypothetical protein